MASSCMVDQAERGIVAFPSLDQHEREEKPLPSTGTDSFLKDVVCVYAQISSWLRATLCRLQSIRSLSPREESQAKQVQGRMAPTRVQKLEDYPRGFPQLACFHNSDDSFMMYRRFGLVFSRLLLHKQDELSRMEATLHGMDKTDNANGDNEYLMSCTSDNERENFPREWPESRTQLMGRMEKKALEYAELLLKTQQLKALDSPSTRDYRSALHFMENDGGQLFEEESGFIYEKHDLISVRPGREHAWLDGIIERVLLALRCKLTRFIFCSKDTEGKTKDPDIHYYDRTRISRFVTMLMTFAILVLLIVPIWLLYRFSIMDTIGTSADTICVILFFTLIFSALLSGFTKAKRHEVLAASAGYCAVLVVFLSNINNKGC